jgi:hypothetical protein
MNAVKAGLAIGIGLLFPLLANMTVQIFRQPPEPMDYYEYYPPQPKSAAERKTAEAEHRAKQERYEKASNEFNEFTFYVTFPMGIAALVGAYALRRKSALAAGLFFGGLATVAFGSYSCWETLPGWQRYVSLLFTLGLVSAMAVLIDQKAKPDLPRD